MPRAKVMSTIGQVSMKEVRWAMKDAKSVNFIEKKV